MFGNTGLKTSDYKLKQMPRKATTAKKVEKQPKESKSKSISEKTPDDSEKTPAKSEKTPAKSKKTPAKSEKPVVPSTVPIEEKVQVPVKAKAKVKAKKVNIKVDTDVETDKTDENELPDVGDQATKKRRVPTKESIIQGFDELVSSIDEEIVRLRESAGKAKGVKFLRSLGKKVKTLRGHSVRVMKQKQKTNRKNNTNSGFLKPVHISEEMAKFTGWNNTDLRSRVDVTKYICKYIRDNGLQNPSDRRQIVADKKLAKLLDFNPEKDEKPLTYYRIQTYMKKHFTNPPVATTPVPVSK